MDRLDSLRVFVAVAEEGSFVAASRRLGHSPAAVTRAVAGLEARLETRLLNRTTRAVSLTDAGARCLERCRRALAELDALEALAQDDRLEPRGRLTLSAPEMFGRLHILPIVQQFLRDHPLTAVSMLLLNRLVSFVDEGVDLGIRIAHLPDSSLRAILVGSVHRVIVASPGYFAAEGAPVIPADLARHQTITVAIAGREPAADYWPFAGLAAGAIRSRLVVTTVQAALDAAVAGGGVARVLSYQAEPLEAAGLLRRALCGFAPPPIPIHVVHPAGRHLAPQVRRFIDRAVPTLRARFSGDTTPADPILL